MSAYVISNRTMTRVLYALHATDCTEKFAQYANVKKLGDHLFAMNADAVAQRYKEKPGVYAYMPERGMVFNPCDALKALRCFQYQCSEGNVPDRPEYAIVQMAINRLQDRIIDALPQYKNADWDSNEEN